MWKAYQTCFLPMKFLCKKLPKQSDTKNIWVTLAWNHPEAYLIPSHTLPLLSIIHTTPINWGPNHSEHRTVPAGRHWHNDDDIAMVTWLWCLCVSGWTDGLTAMRWKLWLWTFWLIPSVMEPPAQPRQPSNTPAWLPAAKWAGLDYSTVSIPKHETKGCVKTSHLWNSVSTRRLFSSVYLRLASPPLKV